jgi:alpha-D-ribose 1-methylphosphonate 5-triphosphate diphosphatase
MMCIDFIGARMDTGFTLHGGASLVQHACGDADWSREDVALFGPRISRVGSTVRNETGLQGQVFDASGLLVLPGIVDIHGDAFERQIQPRPETVFSHDIALTDTDRQLVANGITTACHGLTYSWEGGLRGRDAALALFEQISLQRKTSHADHRIHLRFENHHIDGLPDVLKWIAQGRIDIVAFNEHLPSIAKKAQLPEKLAGYAERARCRPEIFLERLQSAQARSHLVPATIAAIATACRQRGVPMASHDDETCEQREFYQEHGVTISEFPRTQDAIFTAMALDNRVVMGAPNVLLGGSHCGGLATIDAVRSNMCDVMASDYYYPSLLHAPFKLAQLGACSLIDAWRLVSVNPAGTLGLLDRGRIAGGCRADLVLVEVTEAGGARLIATIAAGKVAYCAEPERLTMQRSYSMAA